ncbi:sulfoxide reductase heme-binding subunit YedZ [Pandoraea nosoerga]|uniref:sulfite oxidase heme-binding subunit YedZ n=1 Tax=Pandoraea nosoerga TaxID=2508296 RepID=UPI00158377A7|nr:sulfoxide reductase heme-binding subunit YedZ [Pandoraea nosoerga]MBN4677559.1 sulfoxide reductase heme-binding subunit YedZ [Pandoraea nosoerga]MBN4682391.1 sulfoxide reductase heme-binding subunit YedZ [Pandoraea nosoerga]MBN4746061.1 sulfoxide reductase heme-binding subunit YedZ [Pandoraea nosoerga]
MRAWQAHVRAVPRGGAPRWVPWGKATVFLLALLPLLRLVVNGITDRLGANPVEFITRSTGTWTLVLLCVTLAVTPVRRLPRLAWLLRFRRMLGLFAFFYAALHFTTYFWLDQWFDWASIIRDVTGKRPFITMGFAAFVLMVPLALTSPHAMVRRLGGRRWQRLHRAIYAIAVLAILHYWWMKAGKRDFAEPAIYAIVVACLLGARVLWALRRRAQTPSGSSRSPANSDSTVSRSRTR